MPFENDGGAFRIETHIKCSVVGVRPRAPTSLWDAADGDVRRARIID
jgi:hypothetical protein